MSTSTLSNNVLLVQLVFCLQLYSIYFFTQSSSLSLITCPYHLSLPLLMTVVTDSTPTNFLNYSLVILSFMESPHIHLIICISVLSNYNPTSRAWSHFHMSCYLLTQLAGELWMSEITKVSGTSSIHF